MKDEEIEVGKEYVSKITGERFTLVYKASNSVLLELGERVMLLNSEHFKKHYSPVSTEREKVELFQTCTGGGDIRLCDKDGQIPSQVSLSFEYFLTELVANRSKTPVAYLYTDDFSIEWIMDKE